MYEKRSSALLPFHRFLKRLARSGAFALAMILVSLAIGTSRYAYFENMAPVDAFASSAMILSGM